MEEYRQGVFWIKSDGEEWLSTENMVPGMQAYKEKLLLKKGIEYRLWDPFRSKLAAAIFNGLEIFPFTYGSSVLYLGASTGTTISHISDIAGQKGVVFGVENASRVARDFLERVASHRKNIIPVIQDAKLPDCYFAVFRTVDVVYVDVAQPDQTDIAIANCRMYLKRGGYLFLVVKVRSINAVKSHRSVIDGEIKKLSEFEVMQEIDLSPYDADHALVISRYLGASQSS